MASITIEVDENAARAFGQATALERRKLQMLLSLRLHELTVSPTRTLKEVMDDIGSRAAERGLTPQILESLLRDE